MNSELKPCPFCGGKAQIIYTERNDMYSVRCADEYRNCNIMPETLHFAIEREAIDAWNIRAVEEDKHETD